MNSKNSKPSCQKKSNDINRRQFFPQKVNPPNNGAGMIVRA